MIYVAQPVAKNGGVNFPLAFLREKGKCILTLKQLEIKQFGAFQEIRLKHWMMGILKFFLSFPPRRKML